MLTKTLFNAVVIIAVCGFGATYLGGKAKQADARAAEQAEAAPKAPKTKPPKRPVSASVVSIPIDPRSGQYHTKGRVNSGYVDFLVDTGASTIALTPEDARRAGVRLDQLRYNVPISTAGGRNYAAAVKLDRVSLGGITLRDVDALVVKQGLETSLLGMTWLGQLQEVKATPNALLLRL